MTTPPPKGSPFKEGPPQEGLPTPDTEDPFADLMERNRVDAQFSDEASLPMEDRITRIRQRREDESDEAVILGRSLGEKLAGPDRDTPVDFSDEELSILLLDPSCTHPQGNVLAAARHRIRALTNGSESIFRAPQRISAEEGRRRVAGESTLLSLQSAFIEIGRRQIFEGRYAEGISTSGFPIPDLPQWCLRDLVAKVESSDFSDRSNLEALVALRKHIPDPVNAEEIIDADPEKLDPVGRLWIRARNADIRLTQIKEEEGKEKKRREHEEKEKTLEGDTYRAAIHAGREAFEFSLGVQHGDSFHFRESGLTAGGEAFHIHLQYLTHGNPDFANAISDARRSQSGNDPRRFQLGLLQRLSEDSDLFSSCVDTLASNVNTDQTGWGRADYQAAGRESEWRERWSTTLRRIIDGYSIGMIEGAVEMAPQNPALGGRIDARRESIRSEVVFDGFQVLFGEYNILNPEDVKRMNPFQLKARDLLGKYRLALIDRNTIDIFLTGEKAVVAKAAEGVAARKAAAGENRRKAIAQKEEASREAIAIQEEVSHEISALEAFRDGQLADARGMLSAAIIFQGEDPDLKWVEINESTLKISVNENQRLRVENSLKEAERDLKAEVEKGEEADKEKIKSLRTKCARGRLECMFMKALTQKLGRVNGRTTTIRRGGLLPRNKIVFTDPNPPELAANEYLKIDSATQERLDRIYAGLFGEKGKYAGLRRQYEDLKTNLDASETLPERKRIIDRMEKLGRELKELKIAAETHAENHSRIDGRDLLEYPVGKLAQKLGEELKRRGMLSPS